MALIGSGYALVQAYPHYEALNQYDAGTPTPRRTCTIEHIVHSGYACIVAYPHHAPSDDHAGYAYIMAYPASPALRHSAGYARPQAYPHFLGSKLVVPLSLTPKGDHFAPYQYHMDSVCLSIIQRSESDVYNLKI